MRDCLFCRIAAGEIPAEVVGRGDGWVAFRDLKPQAPTHVLLVPEKHVATLNDLAAQDDALIGKMIRGAAEIAAAEGVAEEGYRLVFNCNAGAGQSVFHVHGHLLAGRPSPGRPVDEDGPTTSWCPRGRGRGGAMSDIVKRIAEDQRAALKRGDRVRLSTLRLLSSDLKNRRIELGRDLNEEESLAVLARAQKQRREAEEQFRKGARGDLADREAAEAVIIAEYLPAPLEEQVLDGMIEAVIAETGASGMKDMGRVMARLMTEVRGRVDGAIVSAKVRERLG